MVKLLSELAPAKINLFLRVTGRRADGYHELDSLFAPISLYDRVSLAIRPAPQCAISLRCEHTNLGPDDDNLAVRAARAFMTKFGLTAEVMIDLHKEIPVGAGLGGGSSDAGAVLRMMARLTRIEDPARLAAIALRLGADVPFFLDPAPARVRGIGERIEPLAGFTPLVLLIAVPPVAVSTAAVFQLLAREGWSGPAPNHIIEAAIAGRLSSDVLINDLAAPAMTAWPEIARLKSLLEQLGALGAAMSGSGGAVFGIFPTAADASHAAEQLRVQAPRAKVFDAVTLGHLSTAKIRR
ncbi:MAG TPA: 4-(cytidine 5'-diphospho)-2-C-methyl-D-erythritol kinase [Candidatus Binataceae bacterium]|nr:4-(cytidine 5'-diphospho)-2-C-methyl-D-erythritol kinase [Candidatus Binataceae bacterium]